MLESGSNWLLTVESGSVWFETGFEVVVLCIFNGIRTPLERGFKLVVLKYGGWGHSYET